MPTPDELERIEDLAEEILDIVGGSDPDEPGEPGVLQPPTSFKVKWDKRTRRATAHWVDAPGAVATEVHEDLTDPDGTLKATVPAGVGERESSELEGGHPYAYRLRSVGPDGEVSAFTEPITIDVPRKGDDEPDEPDENDEPDEDDGEDDDGGEEPQPGGPHPTDILPELEHWTITLPIPKPGTTDSPQNDYMVGKSLRPYFYVRDDGVVFCANAGGTTTENSHYPRSEARQMVRGKRWEKESRSSAEPHALKVDLAIDTRGLTKRRRISGMQIHDGGDDVIQLIHDAEEGLGVSYKDGDEWAIVDRDYQDGHRFTCWFVTVPRDPDEYDTDLIEVHYNGRVAAKIEARGSGWYDKVGAYLQTNVEKWGEDPHATGEVVVYGLMVEAA
ncbi:polysaccharide lyase family 7 protein [Pseudonocardia zijingensis]|uniref:Alginate lyase 2 domain-containing protein n=1 Tax=Pseudonocardia zijingensis TaxID=153376 RepID=A0ABN1N8W9_9PSEU